MSTTTTPVNAKISTIQPIEGAKGNIALYYYQGKYPIYKSLDDGLFHLKSVMDAYKATVESFKNKNLTDWRNSPNISELTNHFRELGFSNSQILLQKRQQNNDFRYLDGWYAREELMLDFAGWLNVRFKCEIYQVLHVRRSSID